jgi:3-hydroxymyristoyl/3-hydroxydecanoyl-(acyl carrier protein) dehydratase
VGSDGKEINEGASRHQQPLFIAADHPVFAGHFPDAPVVPGGFWMPPRRGSAPR